MASLAKASLKRLSPLLFTFVSKTCKHWKIWDIIIFQSFMLILTPLKKTWQGIYSYIHLFLTMIDIKRVLRELLSLTNLSKVLALSIHKLTEVVEVSKNKNLLLRAFKVVIPSLKESNNGQELLILSFITSFGKDYYLRKKNYRMPMTNFRFRKYWIFMGHIIKEC